MDNKEFSDKLKESLNLKYEWFEKECLPDMLEQYRLFHSCIKNLYDMLVRRTLISDDPYRLDKRIVDVVIPDQTPFKEQEFNTIFGARLSDYEMMLDFICTYIRFSVETFTLPKIKKLIEFNNYFNWDEMSQTNKNVNTRALATVLDTAKVNTDAVTQSMISDSITKCGQARYELNKELTELAVFQKELYKCELRKDLFEHPSFRADKAKESAEAELSEIKRLYTKVMGKKPFYGDLISEIIKEDHDPNREKIQNDILNSIKIKSTKKVIKKKNVIEPKEVLMGAIVSVGLLAPTITILKNKLSDNFDLLFAKKSSFFSNLAESLKKMLGIKDKERIIILPMKDSGAGVDKSKKIVVSDFLYEFGKKERICSGIAAKGSEYRRIESSSEESIFMFLTKQVSELQKIFNIINSLDPFFKREVDPSRKARVRGLQMDLSIFKTGIIKVNKKRGEYVAYKDETEQMKKLGIVEDEE